MKRRDLEIKTKIFSASKTGKLHRCDVIDRITYYKEILTSLLNGGDVKLKLDEDSRSTIELHLQKCIDILNETEDTVNYPVGFMHLFYYIIEVMYKAHSGNTIIWTKVNNLKEAN